MKNFRPVFDMIAVDLGDRDRFQTKQTFSARMLSADIVLSIQDMAALTFANFVGAGVGWDIRRIVGK
jgi:hypothetical protein